MKKALHIALAQAPIIWEDASANIALWDERIEKMDAAADLIVLPEMFNTGFTMNAAGVAETMAGQTCDWLCKKSNELGSAICGSMIIKEQAKFYNRFVWAEGGKMRWHYDKRHLFRMADEHHVFSPGRESQNISFEGWQIMPRVCYDLRFPVWSRSNAVDLQIYVANWPTARAEAWDKLLMARAIENQCFVLGVNRIGRDGKGVDYSGHSIVINAKGEAISPEKNESEGWIFASIEPDELIAFREKFPVRLDADRFSIEH